MDSSTFQIDLLQICTLKIPIKYLPMLCCTFLFSFLFNEIAKNFSPELWGSAQLMCYYKKKYGCGIICLFLYAKRTFQHEYFECTMHRITLRSLWNIYQYFLRIQIKNLAQTHKMVDIKLATLFTWSFNFDKASFLLLA